MKYGGLKDGKTTSQLDKHATLITLVMRRE